MFKTLVVPAGQGAGLTEPASQWYPIGQSISIIALVVSM